MPDHGCAWKLEAHLGNTGALLLYVKKVLKDLHFKKLLSTVVKRDILIDKNVGIVIWTVNENLKIRILTRILGPVIRPCYKEII